MSSWSQKAFFRSLNMIIVTAIRNFLLKNDRLVERETVYRLSALSFTFASDMTTSLFDNYYGCYYNIRNLKYFYYYSHLAYWPSSSCNRISWHSCDSPYNYQYYGPCYSYVVPGFPPFLQHGYDPKYLSYPRNNEKYTGVWISPYYIRDQS